jgi:hypothetical protein
LQKLNVLAQPVHWPTPLVSWHDVVQLDQTQLPPNNWDAESESTRIGTLPRVINAVVARKMAKEDRI